MTICPIAIAVGCKKCPAFKICPAKRLLGDMPSVPKPTPTPTPQVQAKASARPAAKAATKTRSAKPKSVPKKKQPTSAGQ